MSGLSGVTAPLTTKRARLEHERLVVAHAVLGAGVGDELHPPRALVIVRGLGRVADDEDDGVPTCHGERVLRLVVLHEADEGRELLRGEAGLLLRDGEVTGHLGSVLLGGAPGRVGRGRGVGPG